MSSARSHADHQLIFLGKFERSMLGPLKINATRKRSRGIRGSLKQVLISLVKPGQMRLRMVLFFLAGRTCRFQSAERSHWPTRDHDMNSSVGSQATRKAIAGNSMVSNRKWWSQTQTYRWWATLEESAGHAKATCRATQLRGDME